ncbi:hypothetical protein [Photorhabdus heterorhabditis]|uniref:hypothetical protein n=1 Tax=Photorhabdus heterorhabditis TaxID=880156 RepID=UPI001BD36F7C|nr:hypothetical protein [Photorhabdus heterorhabditis]MBS9442444.1 hypothetical protein [Photorhabdus heterorhabditis]
MKLINTFPIETKTVDYFGIQLTVLRIVECLATDEDGFIYAYREAPRLDDGAWLASNFDIFCMPVACVDLECIDWKETLVQV